MALPSMDEEEEIVQKTPPQSIVKQVQQELSRSDTMQAAWNQGLDLMLEGADAAHPALPGMQQKEGSTDYKQWHLLTQKEKDALICRADSMRRRSRRFWTTFFETVAAFPSFAAYWTDFLYTRPFKLSVPGEAEYWYDCQVYSNLLSALAVHFEFMPFEKQCRVLHLYAEPYWNQDESWGLHVGTGQLYRLGDFSKRLVIEYGCSLLKRPASTVPHRVWTNRNIEGTFRDLASVLFSDYRQPRPHGYIIYDAWNLVMSPAVQRHYASLHWGDFSEALYGNCCFKLLFRSWIDDVKTKRRTKGTWWSDKTQVVGKCEQYGIELEGDDLVWVKQGANAVQLARIEKHQSSMRDGPLRQMGSRDNICSVCLAVCTQRLACAKCKRSVYCTSECQKEAWFELGHRQFCAAYQQLLGPA